MIAIRLAIATDLEFLKSRAEPPIETVVARQIQEGRLQVIEVDGFPLGLIKSYILWERLPFIEVLWLEQAKRGLGIGRRAVRLWEEEYAGRGFDRAIISTQAVGTAQQFWRKIGYADCGILMVGDHPTEIFMERSLASRAPKKMGYPRRWCDAQVVHDPR